MSIWFSSTYAGAAIQTQSFWLFLVWGQRGMGRFHPSFLGWNDSISTFSYGIALCLQFLVKHKRNRNSGSAKQEKKHLNLCQVEFL
jgi:hypothetical protein